MKRTLFYTVLVLVVLFAATVVFWHFSRMPAINNSETPPTTTLSVTNSLPAATGAPSSHPQISNEQNQQPRQMYMDTNAPEFQKLIKAVHAQSEKLQTERKKPIEFHGKVVDEETQAVAGASIHFIWLTDEGTPETNSTSATDGSFSLAGVLGGSVSVSVWKTDYYEIRSLNQHDFDNTGNGSSSDNPVLFHLRKKGAGADLITSKYGFAPNLGVSAPLDGKPVWVDFFNRGVGSSGQLEISQVKPPYNGWKSATQWSYKLAIPDGGLIVENDEFPFEAPQEGYQPVVEFNFQQGQNWKTDLKEDYYIKFGNPSRYGRIHVETSIMSGTSLQYFINPDGSRYLEPKP